jgi:hypothetical protein
MIVAGQTENNESGRTGSGIRLIPQSLLGPGNQTTTNRENNESGRTGSGIRLIPQSLLGPGEQKTTNQDALDPVFV